MVQLCITPFLKGLPAAHRMESQFLSLAFKAPLSRDQHDIIALMTLLQPLEGKDLLSTVPDCVSPHAAPLYWALLEPWSPSTFSYLGHCGAHIPTSETSTASQRVF